MPASVRRRRRAVTLELAALSKPRKAGWHRCPHLCLVGVVAVPRLKGNFSQEQRMVRKDVGRESEAPPAFHRQEWSTKLRLVKRPIHKDKFFFVDIDADGAAPGFSIDQPGGFVFAAAGNRR